MSQALNLGFLLLQELLVPVPTALFQGSLLLGSITRFALGPEALAKGEVLISPLAIAGWCGLITNALNLLPVGSLDGGRMIQVGVGGGSRECRVLVWVQLGLL